mmetsp:Transcript_13396/g.34364  ORF Transcript_13396/g.34364 Transcript_13396/m.34364 type:complete len:249 (-) Transcript_13396:153-899(-)|eukprot:jgi/Tetstr1/421176/TSEL_012218.t1
MYGVGRTEVRTPGGHYFDAMAPANRFEPPKASLAYDPQGRMHYGLDELEPRVSQREHFEMQKHEHNMKLQEQDLQPSAAKKSLRESYERNLRLEAEKFEQRVEQVRSSHVGTNHHLYRMSEDNPLRLQSAADAALPVSNDQADVVVPRPRGRVNAHTPSSESAMLGGTITGDNDNAELRRYQARQQQARALYEACKQQEVAELHVYTENPHGLTTAQQRQYREQGFRVRGLGYGEETSANSLDRRVLR